MAKEIKKGSKVFVAMSGGVDSSVTAALLQKQGYDVYGVYMKEWSPPGIECASGDDRAMAARVAVHLDIPFAVWDFRHEYKKSVVDYMLREYGTGRTPNPDVMCNRDIKFGIFLRQALRQGADFIATGHYVYREPQFPIINYQFPNRNDLKHSDIENSLKIVNCKLKIAKDLNKDQSYFLWTLTQKELKHCLFPIGDYKKPKVRELAKKFGLPSWDKKDSQGVCFVGKLDFGKFLRKYLPHKKGRILTTDSKEIGTHDGVWFYTIGQRHGLDLRSKNHELRIKGNRQTRPHYVVEKDMKTNILVVAEETQPELYKKELMATNMSWISGKNPKLPFICRARIRYRQTLQKCRIVRQELRIKGKRSDSLFLILFVAPQRAITPGQSIVFYKGKEMLGGGVIA